MTKEEFTNIYHTGTKEHVKEAIEEMNKQHTITELGIMLEMNGNTFRNRAGSLGVKANKKLVRRAQARKWGTL